MRGIHYILVDGKHDRKHGREVWRSLEKYLAFVEGFAHEFVLFVVEFEDSLLQIADTTMYELCGFRRRPLRSGQYDVR